MRFTVTLTAALVLTPSLILAQSQPPARPPAVKPAQTAASQAVTPMTVAAGEPDWRFADPTAMLIGGINIERLARSELIRGTLEQIRQRLPESQATLDKTLGPRPDISHVSFSLRQNGQDPDVLVLINGSMDEAAVAKALQSKLQVRRIDLNAVLLGNGPSLDAAVRRLSRPALPLQAPLFQQGKALAAAHDSWMAGSMPSVAQTAMLQAVVRGFSLGLDLRQDVRMELNVNFANAQLAQDIVQRVRASKADLPPGASLDIHATGSAARFLFAMDGAHVQQAVADAMAGGLNAQLGSLFGAPDFAQAGAAPAATPKPAPIPAPARKSVVIYGLDDGPREVPLGPRP
jgi:hypothetical protein